MNRQALVLLVALAAIACSLLALWPRSTEPPFAGDPTAVPAERPDAPASARATNLDEEDSAPADAPRRPAALLAPWLRELLGDEPPTDPDAGLPTATITGRLAWQESLLPVADARVRLQREARDTVVPEPGEDLSAPPEDPETSTVTNHLGQFELAQIPVRENLFLRFELTDGTVEIREVRSLPEAGARTWQGEYLLEPRGSLVGRIVGPDGAPVPAVRLRAVDELRFDDPDVPFGVREGRVTGAETFPLEPADARRPRNALEARQRLLPYPTATTRADGSFRVAGIREGELNLIVQHEALVGRRVEVPIVAGRTTDLGTIALEEAGTFTVRVVDPARRPVAAVRVAVKPRTWSFGPPAQRTGADGSATFRLGNAGGGEGSLDSSIEVSLRRGDDSPWTSVGAFSPPGLEIELATAADIEARVEFLGGSPAPAAVRFATRPEIQALRWSQSGVGYRVRGVPPELMVALAAVAPGFAPGVANIPHRRPRTRNLSATDEQVAEEPAAPLLPRVAVLTLVPTFALQVQVVDDEMRPLPGVRVAFAPRRPERWRAVPGTDWPDFVRGADLGLTGADGLVEAEGLWDTEVVFTASRHDRGAVHLKKDALSPGQRIVIRLPALARITGNIVADGAAVSRRYRVQLAMPPATEVAQLHPVRDPVEVVSDDEGGFELPRIGAGDWILEVLEPRLPRQGYGQPDLSASRKHLTQPLAVEPGTHVDLTLDLSKSQRTATVVGRFSLGGVPAAGVRVELWDERPFVVPGQSIGHRAQRIAATWTDAQGGFSFDERWRRSGQVRVFVARHGKQVQFAEVELRTEERRSRRTEPVLIDVPIGDLALELRGADHLPLARRPLRLVGPGGVVLPVVADDEGQVRESGLPAGAYRIVATGPVGKLLDFGEPVVVAAGETTTTWREAGR